MFILQIEDPNINTDPNTGSTVSQRTVTPDNPIYVEVDSTDAVPEPTNPIKCYVSLPAPYVCIKTDAGGGALIKFEGTTARNWTITNTNETDGTPNLSGWGSSLTVSVGNSASTVFWIQATTEGGDEPRDDRSVAMKITGEVEKN